MNQGSGVTVMDDEEEGDEEAYVRTHTLMGQMREVRDAWIVIWYCVLHEVACAWIRLWDTREWKRESEKTMMPFAEDISIDQCTNILKLITLEYQRHIEHCLLCIPARWLCPDAHILQGNIKHWDERLTSMLPKEGSA